MDLHTRRLARITVSAALAVGLALGSTAVTTPAQAEPVGVVVPAFKGGAVTNWGTTSYSQHQLPASLSGKTVTAVAAGYGHILAVTSDGALTGWGRNGDGQVDVPASLAGKTVTAAAAGAFFSLALTSDGTVTGWGRDGNGQATVPGTLAGKTVTAIAAGYGQSLALTSDGAVTAWGRNVDGEATVPGTLTGKTVTAIAAGYEHSLALTSDGTVTVWGTNDEGQRDVPATPAGKTITAVAAGGYHSLALTSDGTVIGWGENDQGQATIPDTLAGKTVTAIAAGTYHSLALTSDGTVTAWGFNPYGETTVPGSLAGRVVTAIAAGIAHSVAIATDFAAERAPIVTGTAEVGGSLTVDPGRYVVTPDSLGYQWYADGAVIPGATAATLALTPDHTGKRITARVTATLSGRAPAVTTSGAIGPVVGAPTIRLSAAPTSLRRGQSTTLTWTSTDAPSLSATGAWTGTRTPTGAVQVTPSAIGTTTYVLTASNVHGTTTAQIQVKVIRPAARLKVTAPKGDHRPGAKVKVKVRGLEAGERYTIRVGKRQVAVGTAKNARPITTKIKLPKKSGKAIVRVSGDQPDRTGAAKLRVVRR